jgi:hypothetical protein
MALTKATQNVLEGIVATGSTGISAGSFIVTQQYKITSLGNTTQSQWNTIAGTTGKTYVAGSLFTAVTTGASSGTGVAAVARTLANRFGDVANVLDFGAVSDYYLAGGIINPNPTDNTVAFQNAVNYASTLLTPSTEINYPVVKGAVYIPSGAYYIASGSSITLKKGVCIFGESRSSSQIIHGGGGVPCITSDNSAIPPTNSNVQIQIEKLSITGNGASTTYGIYLKDSYRDSDIREVTINNCNVNLYLKDSFTTFIDRCDFQFSITDQIEIVDATAVTIFNCRMDNAGRHGIYLNGTTNTSVHTILENNQIQRCQGAGIYAVDIDSIYINNGYFEGNNRLDLNWSDIHWIKAARNRGTNGNISNCFATATTGGSNGRFVTADIPGILTVINCRNYDDNLTPDPAYEYGIYLGTSIVKFISIGNTLEGTISAIGRATTSTPILDDYGLRLYIPNSNIIVTEGGTGTLNFNLVAGSGKDSSIVLGNADDAAQASVNYLASTKRITFNGYDNSQRCSIKEQGQFGFGKKITDPTLDLEVGDVYYNTSTNKLKVYTASGWETITSM